MKFLCQDFQGLEQRTHTPTETTERIYSRIR